MTEAVCCCMCGAQRQTQDSSLCSTLLSNPVYMSVSPTCVQLDIYVCSAHGGQIASATGSSELLDMGAGS